MKQVGNIAITGASSGLGAALARHYARPGRVLFLSGRNPARLAEIAAQCEKSGAAVHQALVDVTDAAAVTTWLHEADKTAAIDLIIANAGISAGIGGGGESAGQARAIFVVNIDGVMNTVQPLLPAMLARRRGKIAIISSLAGMRGLPSSPAYSASKACVRAYAEGLRGWLAPHGVEVNAVCPGFIKTPMTDVNPYPMPMMMDADKAARIIARGLARNKGRIAFPWRLYAALLLANALPLWLTDPLFSRMPGKPSIAPP